MQLHWVGSGSDLPVSPCREEQDTLSTNSQLVAFRALYALVWDV